MSDSMNMKEEEKPPSVKYSGFFFITMGYFIARTMMGDGGKWDTILLAAYVLSMVLYEFNNSLEVTKKKCGSPRYNLAFYYVVVPWLLIFGTLNAMLIQFPGWKAPFANTFGYLFLKLSGIERLMRDILVEEDKANDAIKPSIRQIYRDQSLLVNEITPQNFDEFWGTNKDIFNANAEQFKEKLRSKIVLKDAVSEFIWFYLTGSLIMALSFNYLNSASCDLTAEELKANRAAFEAEKAASNTATDVVS